MTGLSAGWREKGGSGTDGMKKSEPQRKRVRIRMTRTGERRVAQN